MTNNIEHDMAAFSDSWGLIQATAFPFSLEDIGANGLLFTAEILIMAKINGLLTQDMLAKYRKNVEFCLIEKGHLARHPVWVQGPFPFDRYWLSEPTLHDDYMGVCLFFPDIAREVLAFGNSNMWWFGGGNYKSSRPWYHFSRAEFWLGRLPGFIAHIKHCAGVTPSWFEKFVWRRTMIESPQGEETHDKFVHGYLASLANPEGRDRFITAAKAVFPRGPKELFAEYFKNSDHPIAVWAPDNWEDAFNNF